VARHGRNGQLPERQARFVKHYLICLNASEAYRRAGYAKKNAHVCGPRLLANARIQAEIEKASKKINEKLEITAERVKAELAKLAFSNMEDYVVHENGDLSPDLSKCTRDQMAAVQEFTVDSTGGTGDGERKLILRTKFKLAPKREALELLGRMRELGLFSDKIEVTASDEVLAAIAEGRKRVAACRQR